MAKEQWWAPIAQLAEDQGARGQDISWWRRAVSHVTKGKDEGLAPNNGRVGIQLRRQRGKAMCGLATL
jgi:hypothetical protein